MSDGWYKEGTPIYRGDPEQVVIEGEVVPDDEQVHIPTSGKRRPKLRPNSNPSPLVFESNHPWRFNTKAKILAGTGLGAITLVAVGWFNYQSLGYRDPRQGIPEPRPSITQPIHTESATQTPKSTTGSVQVSESPSLPPEIILPPSESPSESAAPTPSKTLPEITTPAAEPTPTQTEQTPEPTPTPTPSPTTPTVEPAPTLSASETVTPPDNYISVSSIRLNDRNVGRMTELLNRAQAGIIVLRNAGSYREQIAASTNCDTCKYGSADAPSDMTNTRIIWRQEAYNLKQANATEVPTLDFSWKKVGFTTSEFESKQGNGTRAIMDTQLPRIIRLDPTGQNARNFSNYVQKLVEKTTELQKSEVSVTVLLGNDYRRLPPDMRQIIDNKLAEQGFAKKSSSDGTNFIWNKP